MTLLVVRTLSPSKLFIKPLVLSASFGFTCCAVNGERRSGRNSRVVVGWRLYEVEKNEAKVFAGV